MINFNKKEELVNKIISLTRSKAKEEQKRVEETQQAINNAPDYRKTWSDTTKFQLRQLKNNLQAGQEKTKKALQALLSLNTQKDFKKVEIGALVQVKDEAQNNNIYFIVPAGSFNGEVELGGRQVVVISSTSPLAQVMLGRKTKEKFNWRGETLTVQSVS